jgi:DNA-binding transcriptional LysR family regulator
MSDLSIAQLRRLDLTLLLVFLGLLRHRKALDVAGELGLTQSAISQAVKRLRDIFEDELFLRRPYGMEPTAVALSLEAPVAQAVEALRGALGAARSFDPATASGIVRVAALDAQQAVLIPPLAAALRRHAPGLRLSVLSLARGDAVEALLDGLVDLSIGFLWDMPEVIFGETLYAESYLVAARPDVMPDPLDLDAYCQADHVLVAPGGDLRGVVDEQLAGVGRSRNVVLGLPGFLPALAAVAASEALMTLPSRVATAFAPAFGLVTAPPPLDIRRFPVSVFWHRRNDADMRTRWLRRQLAATSMSD